MGGGEGMNLRKCSIWFHLFHLEGGEAGARRGRDGLTVGDETAFWHPPFSASQQYLYVLIWDLFKKNRKIKQKKSSPIDVKVHVLDVGIHMPQIHGKIPMPRMHGG